MPLRRRQRCISPLGFSEGLGRSLGRLRGLGRRRAARPTCEHPHEASRRSNKRRHDVNVELNGYGHPLQGVTTPLSVGLGIGTPHGGAHEDSILFGPELQFGNVVGNHIKKQVLLLKYAVGGSYAAASSFLTITLTLTLILTLTPTPTPTPTRSLYKSWRPPSAVTSRPLGPRVCGTNCGGKECMPDYAERFNAENKADACCDYCCVPCSEAKCIQNGTCTCRGNLVQNGSSFFDSRGNLVQNPLLSRHSCGKTNNTGYTTAEGLRAGREYVDMVSTIKNRLDEIGTKDIDYKIAGFAWFQGWSDATSKPDWVEHEYEENMADFIKDVRAEFNESALPFIISGPGMDGYESRGKANICNAQRRAADRPELNESTIYVESRTFAAR